MGWLNNLLNEVRNTLLRWWKKESKEEKKLRADRAFEEASFFVHKGKGKPYVIERLLKSGLVFTKSEATFFYERALVSHLVEAITEQKGAWKVENPGTKNVWPLIQGRLQQEGLNPTLIEIARERYWGELVRYLKRRGKPGAKIAERLRFEGCQKYEAYDAIANEDFSRFLLTFADGQSKEYSRRELERLNQRDIPKGTETKRVPYYFVAMIVKGGLWVSEIPLEPLRQTQRSVWGDLAAIPSLIRSAFMLRGERAKESAENLSRIGNLDLEFTEWPDQTPEYKGLFGGFLYLFDWVGERLELHMGKILLALAVLTILFLIPIIVNLIQYGVTPGPPGVLEGIRRG